jgi:tetratricopeptide (TPR) repeat protein
VGTDSRETPPSGRRTEDTEDAKVWRWVLGIGGLLVVLAFRWLISPSDTQNQMMKVNMAIWSDNPAAALAILDKMIAQTPNWGWAHERRGEAFRIAGEPVRALAEFQRAIEIHPDDGDAWLGLCRIRRAAAETEAAIAACDKANFLKPNGEAALASAELVLGTARFAEAYRRLNEAEALWSSNAYIPFLAGRLALWELDRPGDAAADLGRATSGALAYLDTWGPLTDQMTGKPSPGPRMAPGHAFFPDALYGMLWKYIALQRTGGDAAGQIASDFEQLGAPIRRELVLTKMEDTRAEARARTLEPWPALLVGRLAGVASEAEIESAIARARPELQGAMRCDTEFYLGMAGLPSSDPQRTRERLAFAAANCPDGKPERGWAARALQRETAR